CDWSSDVCSSDLVPPPPGVMVVWPSWIAAMRRNKSAGVKDPSIAQEVQIWLTPERVRRPSPGVRVLDRVLSIEQVPVTAAPRLAAPVSAGEGVTSPDPVMAAF